MDLRSVAERAATTGDVVVVAGDELAPAGSPLARYELRLAVEPGERDVFLSLLSDSLSEMIRSNSVMHLYAVECRHGGTGRLRAAQRDAHGMLTEGPRLMETIDRRVELPVSELLECAVVAGRFVEPDERVATGNVWLSADGGHRIWRAVGPAVALELRGETDPARYDVLVPARLLNAAALVAGSGETVTLTAGTERGTSRRRAARAAEPW